MGTCAARTVTWRPAAPSPALQVLLEFKEYATEVDVDFVRKAVRAIGYCAVSIPSAAERWVQGAPGGSCHGRGGVGLTERRRPLMYFCNTPCHCHLPLPLAPCHPGPHT